MPGSLTYWAILHCLALSEVATADGRYMAEAVVTSFEGCTIVPLVYFVVNIQMLRAQRLVIDAEGGYYYY